MKDPVDLLKDIAYTDESADPGREFEEMVMSRWRAESLKRTAQYWLPSALGAVAAALALLAVVQWTMTVPESKQFQRGGAEAKLTPGTAPALPTFTDQE